MTKSLSKTEIFDQAKALTTGDRMKAYGSVDENFQRTADLWNAYLQGRDMSKQPIELFEVGIFNQLQKSLDLHMILQILILMLIMWGLAVLQVNLH